MNNKFLAIAFFCCTFIISYVLIQHLAVHTVDHFRIEGAFPKNTEIHVDTSNGLHGITQNKRFSQAITGSSASQLFNMPFGSATITQFRMTINEPQRDFSISTIAIYSFFNKPIIFDQQQLASAFTITQAADHTVFTLKQPLQQDNILFSGMVAFLFSLCVLLLIVKTNWQAFPAIQDFLATQNTSNPYNFSSLDGLRGLAALLVFLQHSTGFFHGVGDIGVWIFFVLSGFLLTRPFVLDHSYAVQKDKMLSFLSKRVKRIVPLFFFVITVIYLANGSYSLAIRHYLFIQGDGHFWTILQEMYFYMMLPAISLIVYFVCKRNNLAAIALLSFTAILWAKFGTIHVFSIYGFHHAMRGYFEVFILGMIGAYFYFGVFEKNTKIQGFFANNKNLFSIFGFILLLGIIFLSMILSEQILGFDFHIKNRSLISALLCLIVILLAITTKNSWYNKILCNPFLRYIGIIGYSFYLIHPYTIFLSRNIIFKELLLPDGNFIWLISSASFVLTILFASFTYSFIERPFLNTRTVLQGESNAKPTPTS